jgi:hypothetical protein
MTKGERAIKKWADGFRKRMKKESPAIYECMRHLSDEDLITVVELQRKMALAGEPPERFVEILMELLQQRTTQNN